MTYKYLILSRRAPNRLADLKRDAEKLNAMPHRKDMPPTTWRDVRYADFQSHVSLSQGFNGEGRNRVPVWYASDSQFTRERYADECESVGRSIDHEGWYADPAGHDTIRGLVVALPHGRFLAGYELCDCGQRTYFADLYADERTAAFAADRSAELLAESEREYRERCNAARELSDGIDEMVTRLRECLVLRHKACMSYVRDEIGELVGSIRQNRETLATDYANLDY